MSHIESSVPGGMNQSPQTGLQPSVPTSRAPRRNRPLGFVFGRIVYSIVLLFGITLLVFIATQAIPGDPAQAILGRAAPERVEALREDLGLNRPLTEQYTEWIGGVVTGDLGTSLTTRESVGSMIGPRLTKTLLLVFITAVIAIPLSIVVGAWSALKRDSLSDRAGLLAAVLVPSLPDFVIGMTLVMVFATTVFHVLPAVTLSGGSDLSFEGLVLPVTVLLCGVVPFLYRMVRAETIEVLESDYIHNARLKGLSTRRILFAHAVPNGLVPVVYAATLSIAFLIAGTVIVEYLFAYPGIGSLLLESMQNRDLPLLQAIVLILTTGYLLFNLIADVLTVLVSPRLRTGTL